MCVYIYMYIYIYVYIYVYIYIYQIDKSNSMSTNLIKTLLLSNSFRGNLIQILIQFITC